MALGFRIQSRRFSGVFERCAGRDRVSAHQVREVGTESPVGHCARHGVAVDAGGRLEYALSLGNSATCSRRLALLLNPSVEFILRLDINTQQHLGVLCPAILRTLAEVNSGLLRVDPHCVGVVRESDQSYRRAAEPKNCGQYRRIAG